MMHETTRTAFRYLRRQMWLHLLVGDIAGWRRYRDLASRFVRFAALTGH